MKKTINSYDFRREFETCRPNNFSYGGLSTIFDYLESYEEESGEELELDVVAICCDYSEESPEDIAIYYDIGVSDCESPDAVADRVIEFLEDNGAYVGRGDDDSIVYMSSF